MISRSNLVATLLSLSFATAAVAAPQTNATGMKGMSDMSRMTHNEQAQGVGIVKAVGAANETITLQHQTIRSIGWPAMTMTFKVASPDLLKAIKVGDTVGFSFHPDGMNSTVTAIKPFTR